jgi:hypothetical protein
VNGLELGIASNVLENNAWAHYQLLRLNPGEQTATGVVAGHWEPTWSSRDAAVGDWIGFESYVEFADGGLDRLRLTGPLPDDFENAPRVFAEVGEYSKQQVSSIWERQGDSYVRGTAVLLPTPLTTLSRFIAALREGDLEAASQWVADEDLIEEALGLGWSLPRPEGDWLLATGGDPEQVGANIEFFAQDDRAFRFQVHFSQESGVWRISGIEILAQR